MTVDDREMKRHAAGNGLFDAFAPWGTAPWPAIPHYYGDVTRQLMLGGAALMLLASPLYGSDLPAEFPFEVLGALLVVGFSALTNPHSKGIAIGDAATSGAAAAIYATWAIADYRDVNPLAFVLRIAIAVVFLFAFYFSMKTLRAFIVGSLGRRERVDEFHTDREREEDDRLENGAR